MAKPLPGQRPIYGNAGLFGRTYGVPSGPKPTADQQANAMKRERPRRGRRRSRE
jgi:hypothetical protein